MSAIVGRSLSGAFSIRRHQAGARAVKWAIAALVVLPASASPAEAAIGSVAPAELARECSGKEGYNDAAPPVRIYGNTYYVGTCGISSILIVGPSGDVLIDSGPREAAPLILANLARLGVSPESIKAIVSSHEHFDHVGGLAELKRATGAKLYARAPAKLALQSGMPSPADPQREIHQGFPPVEVDGLIPASGQLKVGPIKLEAIPTPGHTPGSTSWSWRSCERSRCVAIVYADSLSPVSGDTYRFSDHPEVKAAFRSTFGKVASLRCDILVTPHPGASRFLDRLSGKEPLINAGACGDYAARGRRALEARLRSEQKP